MIRTQSDREDLAKAEFDSLPESITQPYVRRVIAARGLVQLMQADGVLPQKMSDERFSRVAQWIAAGMKEAIIDTAKGDYKSV